jgi:hypothetical protein
LDGGLSEHEGRFLRGLVAAVAADWRAVFVATAIDDDYIR